MKCSLNVKALNDVFTAFNQFDGREEVTPGVANGPRLVRVPYKLGAERRAVVRNLNVLKTALESYETTRQAVFKESWPDVEDTAKVRFADYPNEAAVYLAAMKAIEETVEDFDLLPLSGAVAYDAGNEFPIAALAVLEQHGLIADAPAA